MWVYFSAPLQFERSAVASQLKEFICYFFELPSSSSIPDATAMKTEKNAPGI
jgi:hypothetical protein